MSKAYVVRFVVDDADGRVNYRHLSGVSVDPVGYRSV